MLKSLNHLRGYSVLPKGGEMGSIKDFLFDDQRWTIRYIDVDTRALLPGRRVLIAPESAAEPDWRAQTLPVTLTREQIENGPGIDEHKPVSRQYERDLADYYGWAPYWHTGTISSAPFPVMIKAGDQQEQGQADTKTAVQSRHQEPNLRSVKEVTGYHIQGSDGEVGHVEDIIAETDGWMIRYFVVDTRNWLPGRKVLIALDWCSRIDWHTRQLHVDLTQEQIRNSPEYDPTTPVNRELEVGLYDYYGRPAWWSVQKEDK